MKYIVPPHFNIMASTWENTHLATRHYAPNPRPCRHAYTIYIYIYNKAGGVRYVEITMYNIVTTPRALYSGTSCRGTLADFVELALTSALKNLTYWLCLNHTRTDVEGVIVSGFLIFLLLRIPPPPTFTVI